ncbi:thioredoxin [Streptomyces phage Shaeky]|uniref:Thioredoxin n=1 Tax=Streptomyces phage Shaeky TaxID=2767586 RepID=A0A873WE96_9CAUD|nr:thioredoxin [Streptomyces phage Shaeky]
MFGAAWCAPCKKTLPILERVCDSLGLDLEYVDVEFGDSRANDVTAVPTIRVYDDYDVITREHRGGATEPQLRAMLGGIA